MRPVDVERLLGGSPLFDEEWYALTAGVTGTRTELVRHYVTTPISDRVTPQPLFDPLWFAEQWEDAEAGRDLFVDYLQQRPYAVRTSPLLTAGYVRRRVAQEHPHGPVGHLLTSTSVGTLPEDPWATTRGKRPFADLRSWMLAAARRWRARVNGVAVPDGLLRGEGPLVVVGDHADWRLAARTLRALDRTGTDTAEVSVAALDGGEVALTSVMLEAWALRTRLPVTVVPAGDLGGGSTWLDGLGRCVLLAAGTQPLGGWLEPLLAALDEPGVGLVAPVLVTDVGTVRSAGVVGRAAAAYDLLADHPVEDVTNALGRVDLADVRRAAVALAGVPVDGAVRVSPSSRVVVADDVGAPPIEVGGLPVRDLDVDREAPWAALGFEVVAPGQGPGVPPVVRRPALAVSEWPPRLRWALRIASTPGALGDAWGDTHFADSLARALRTAGQEVVVDRRGAFDRPTTYLDDVALVIRGREPMRPVPGAVNLCWVISHPDLLDADEARSYDRVLAASTVWAQSRAAQWGIEVEPMLQATDPTLFAPDPALVDTGDPVLFVGSSRGVDRPVVTDALAVGLPLAVYGPQWEGRVPAGVVRDTYVPNDRLGAAYGAAGVVLNDHWDDMRVEGFWSNRLFDAVAAGARVVTDDVAGLGAGSEGVFGRSVQPYVTPADLVRLCDPSSYDQTFGDLPARLAVAERVRTGHSFDARARRLVELAVDLGAGHA